MNKKPTEFNPDWRVHPGNTIRELFIHRVLENIVLTEGQGPGCQKGARQEKVVKQLDEILKCEGKVTPEIADILGDVFNITPTFFLNLQKNFEKPK